MHVGLREKGNSMSISVCMGTYNGVKYIGEQLYTILHQTVQPDEVIICDDGSSDGTVEIIEKFIEENQLGHSWHLYRNDENKGYPGNFYYAMSLCTKNIVFLADQDDVWHPGKLERMYKIMKKNKNAKVLSCKFGLIDASGGNIHTIMSPTRNRGTGRLRNVTIGNVFYKYEWPGMALSYRNAWYQEKKGSEGCKIPHDFLLCVLAAEEEGLLQMDEELANHRRHDNNAGGEEHRLGKLLNKQRKLREIEEYLRVLEKFEKEQILRTAEGKEVLRCKKNSMQSRLKALQSGKISAVMLSAWKYRRQSRLFTVLCDLVIVK